MVTAHGTFHGQEIEAEVVNPGDWFGRVWLVEIGGSYAPRFLAVEADSVSDAIDELADSEKHGHEIRVADADLGDYDPETCSRAGNDSAIVDLDWVAVHGVDGKCVHWPCVYKGDGLPPEGVKPDIYTAYLEWIEEDPRK